MPVPVLPHRTFGPSHPDHDVPVLLVHGVGVDGSAFDALAARLAERRTVVLPCRRGYGLAAGWLPAPALTHHIDDLCALLDCLGFERASYVGVSGGATLGLIAAMEHPLRWTDLVVHEPLAGSLAGPVHDQIAASAAQLADDTRPAAAVAYVRSLVGESWARLGEAERERVALSAGAVRQEVTQFVAFEPAAADLARLRTLRPLVTVGEHSPPARHEAAAAVARLVGGQVDVVPGVGHLPHVDDPTSFAAVLTHRWAAADHMRSPAT